MISVTLKRFVPQTLWFLRLIVLMRSENSKNIEIFEQ